MTLTELRYIVAVARERHFSRAAESCFVSQPTLSVGVRKLEDELGVKVFERGAKNEVRLTTIGDRIVTQAQRVLEEAEHIHQLAAHGINPLTGPLRLGAIYTIGPYLLPGLIPALHQAAPKMPLLIEEGLTAELMEKLKQGELDVIIVSLPFTEPGVVTQSIYDEPFVVGVPEAHPWSKRDLVNASELSQADVLLLGPGHCFRDQVLQACPDCNRSSGNGLAKTLESSSLETIRYMVASGAGVTVFPCTSINGHAQPGNGLLKTIPLADPAPSRRVVLAWRKTFTRPEAVEVVRQAILKINLGCVRFLPNEPIVPA